jgi:hypothetical protein
MSTIRFRSTTFRPTLAAFIALLASACIALDARAQSETYTPGGGTKSQRPKDKKNDARDEGKKVFAPATTGARNGGGAPHTGWSVMIAGFRDDNRHELAEEGLRKFQAASGLTGAFVEDRGNVSVIAYGQFASATAPDAKAALEKIRTLQVTLEDGRRGTPFIDAFLAPPDDVSGSMPEFDLRSVKKLKGKDALYTLQVAYYGRVDKQPSTAAELADFRKAAEEATLRLRREGEQAYYYHSPIGSTVTIGIFGTSDYTPGEAGGKPEYQSPALSALRKRFPNNLVNGAGVKETVKTIGVDGRPVKYQVLQTSRLVSVPKE